MISQPIQDALNAQINSELEASYLYLAMAAAFEEQNLEGFSHWMRVQSQEETGHAMRIFDYLLDRGGSARLKAIPAPKADVSTPLAAAKQALGHERRVTGLINNLYTLAAKEKDYSTQEMLHWFLSEQVEEENAAELVVSHLERIGADGSGLLIYDRELGERKAAG